MNTQQDPNQPSRPTGAGQQGGEQDRERERARNVSGGGQQAAKANKVVVNKAAAANRAAGDRAAANQADDKTGSFETTKRREVTPAAFVISRNSLCV